MNSASEPQHNPKSPLRRLLPYTTAAMIVAALYVAWIFYSRHQSELKAEAAAEAKRQSQRQQVVDMVYGSGEVRLLAFGADSAVLRRGESTEVCYGVENAKTVKIDPPVGEDLKSSYRHCIEVAPKKTTTYTLTADNGAGDHKSGSITIQVK